MENLETEQTNLFEQSLQNNVSLQNEIENQNENTDAISDVVSFEDLGLDEYTLKAVERKGFVTPSPIQLLAIPRLLTGDTNMIARARTGTGKTAAFGLPIIQSIREKSNVVQALILEPTRELAMQTCTEMQSFSTNDIPRTTVLYGGASYATQIRDLKKGCEIVVGTPGRVKDHIEKRTLDLSKIKYFILDEGDEMLDMGFIDDIEEIFTHANPDCRILLFSATMPEPILKIASKFMGEYETIEEEGVIDEPLLIDQKYWVLRESDKLEALVRLIDISPDFYGLVFTQTKMDADRVTRELDLRGYEAAALHGDIMQNQREKVLERFRMKKTRILVATDVAARGIDISGLTHVVNYSLPFDAATYVHRIGRTGRAGAEGIAVTFVRPEERRKLGFMQKAVAKASKGQMKEGTVPAVKEVLSVKEKRVIAELKEKLFILKNADALEESSVEDKNENAPIDLVYETFVENKTDVQNKENTDLQTDEQVLNILNEDLINPMFENLAEELSQGLDSKKVLAALLSVFYGEKLSPKHYGKIAAPKSFTQSGDMQRVFVSLGKKDGYRAKEIAEFFSKMLHIPGRMVDDIDVAQQFSLVSLPVASAKKAIELSKSNKKLPHMHFDVKEEGRGSRKGGRSGAKNALLDDFSKKTNARGERKSDGRSPKDFGTKKGSGKKEFVKGREKGNRPNVHTQSERASSKKGNNASSFLKKSARKPERF
jgi:ATP-dependent RNA helicase DeaD